MPGPSDRDALIALDRQHLWRPYTSSDDHATAPLLAVERAEGAWLIEADGRRLLDGNGSWWCNLLGHGHPRLREALRRQSERLVHCAFAGITHEPAVRLAEELLAVAPPGLSRVFYSDDGSTSVEVALKMAVQHWQQSGRPERTGLVTLDGAFHGDTIGAMSVGGVAELQGPLGSLLFDVMRAPSPDAPGGWEAAVEWIEALLASQGERVAAVIVEPLIQGAAGMRMWPAELLGRIHEATRRADTFLVADEVFTGFGRTGTMWASEHAGITPDILCLAKGLSGGVLPFAATLATDRVYEGFRGGPERALMHGHTFYGNPLGASVAREVLAVYRDEDVLGQVRRKAPRIGAAFDRIGAIPGTHGARSLGMVGAVEVGEPGYRGRVGWEVYEAALRRGAYLRPLGNTVYICPCLTIDDDDLDRLLSIVEESIAEVLG